MTTGRGVDAATLTARGGAADFTGTARAVRAGEGDDGRGDGASERLALGACVGGVVVTGSDVGIEAGVADGDGSATIAVIAGLGAVLDPPKKWASAPPRSNPAKITTRTSGKSGSPPPDSLSDLRLRCGSLNRRLRKESGPAARPVRGGARRAALQ